jgi:hypothetical protein
MTPSSNIPKFTSFRPKPKLTEEPPKDEALGPEKIPKEEAQRERRRSSPRSKRYREHDHVLSKSSGDEKPPKKKSRSDRRESPPHVENDSKHDSVASRIYYSDRRGDPGVLKYGSLDRRDIPTYRRYGYGCVLGLSADEKIDRENSTDKELYTRSAVHKGQERLLMKKRGAKEGSRSLRLIKTDQTGTDIDRDFVPLSKSRQREHPGDSEDEKPEKDQAPEVDYRGIEGRRTSEPVDPDTHYESDTQDMSVSAEVTKKNSELVRMTREQPENLQAWKDLIDHQEAMMKLDRSTSELSPSDKQHLADVRISTYEQALRKTTRDQEAQVELHLGLLHEARRHWDEPKLAKKWQSVLAEHPCSISLWLEYLDFIQSSLGRFTYEDCKYAFLRCIKALLSASEISVEDILHVFIRLTTMIQEAGYQELALASWQIVLQHKVLDLPGGIAISPDHRLKSLMEFWESELPRIGEPETTHYLFPPDTSPLKVSDTPNKTFQSFERRETEQMTQLRYPGRSTDEVDEDVDEDPFRIVWCSDLEDFRPVIKCDFPQVSLVQAFLCFCKLPPIPHADASREKWWSDPFLQRRSPRSTDQQHETGSFSQTLGRYSNSSIQSNRMTFELLMKQDFSLDDVRLDPAFLKQVLNVLATGSASDESIGEYLLAFESKHFSSIAPKTAKSLLKMRPTSLRLYNAYGLVESYRGNSARADQVFSMALSMQKGDCPLSTMEALQLLNSWVWEALQKEDNDEALWRIISPRGQISARRGQEVRPDPNTLLSARELLSATTERALLSGDYTSAVLSTSLLALLSYLSSNSDPDPAIASHLGLSAWFSIHKLSASPSAELHAQSICRFLTHHATHAPIVKPALIRTTLEPLIANFPNNTVLLSLYAANEARFALDDRVRGIMHQTALQRSDNTSVAGWAFAIHHETLKGEIAGSTEHSIRALYKRATDSTGASCSALWCQYLRFEMAQLEKERARRFDKKPRKDGKKSKWESRVDEAAQRVKETFYAGLKKLPWCKDFIVLVFGLARDVFKEEELWRIYHVMVEKQLRLYVDLDDGAE